MVQLLLRSFNAPSVGVWRYSRCERVTGRSSTVELVLIGLGNILLGALGAGIIIAMDAVAAMQPNTQRKRWGAPWGRKDDKRAYLVVVVLRLCIGAGVALGISHAGGPFDGSSGPFLSFLVGLSAPVIVERLLRYVKTAHIVLGDPPPDSAAIELPPPSTAQESDDVAR